MAKNEETSRIEEILNAQPEIVDIVHDKWEIPDIDYSNFRRNGMLPPENMVEVLASYLNSHYIIDAFTDHSKRIKWERKMNRIYRQELGSADGRNAMAEFLNRSALSLNTMGVLAPYVEMLADSYTGTNREFKPLAMHIAGEIRQLRAEASNGMLSYDLLRNGDKKRYVQNLKKDVYALLKTVAKTSF